jgi:tetratricopeptide (TPR) repeat protein
MSARSFQLLAVAMLGACGTFGLSADESARLAQHQSQAQLYWEGGHIDQALAQTEKGLRIKPDDYKLNGIQAWCLLRMAHDADTSLTPARRNALQEQARVAFERTMALRSFEDHSPQTILGNAMLHEELARSLLKSAAQVRDELERSTLSATERTAREVRQQELELQARDHLAQSERSLARLLERGESRMLAHKHLMNVRMLQRKYPEAIAQAKAFLALSHSEQQRLGERYRATTVVAEEQSLSAQMRQLRATELTVRTQLADFYTDQKEFALALAEIDALLELDPTSAQHYYHRAVCLKELGRYRDSYKDLQKFLVTHDAAAGDRMVLKAQELLREVEARM